MNIEQVKHWIISRYKAGIKKPICMIGHRGIGKTYAVMQIGEILNMEVVHLRLATQEEGDLIGIPRFVDGKTVYGKPAWLREEPFILFLDEFNRQLRPEVLNACTQLIEQYQIHTHKLPKGSLIILAGNPTDGNYETVEIDPAWQDRITEVEIEFSFKAFHKYITQNKWNPLLIKFLETHQDLAFQPPSTDKKKKTPSPRGWEIINEYLEKEILKIPFSHDAIEMIAGDIGDEAATIFAEFIKKEGKAVRINADDFFNNIEKFTRDVIKAVEGNRNDKIAQALEVVIMKIEEDPEKAEGKDKKTVENIKKFVKDSRIPESFRFLLMQKIVQKDPELNGLYMQLVIDDELVNIVKEMAPIAK